MPRQKTLLLMGGGYADIPLIIAAKRIRYRVVTTGNRPDDLGHRYSDEYRRADFSDKESMLAMAIEVGAEAVCASCNDFAALSAAYVAERMGLPGHDRYDTALILHHKDRYRIFASEIGIPTPRARGFSSVASALLGLSDFSFPVIVKPVDLTGGKGISVVLEPHGARAALEGAFGISRAKRVVVEEFVTGSRHGFSAILRGGRVVFFFSDNEHYFLNPYMVSAASTPSIVPPEAEEKLCAMSERIAAELALVTGIFHVQYILHAGEPVIIEICRRAPGDLYVRLVELATRVDYSGWIVGASAGFDCPDMAPTSPLGFFTRHCVMSARPGRVRSVDFDPEISDNVIDTFMWWQPGDEIADVMAVKLGIVFLKFSSLFEMLDKTERMHDLIRVAID